MHSIVSIGDEETTVQSNMCKNTSDPAAYCDVCDKDTASQIIDEMEVLAGIQHISGIFPDHPYLKGTNKPISKSHDVAAALI